jgi:ABC-type branched-subunit amino acid transport system ATPase component
MDSSVLLSTDELRVRTGSREPLDLAVLSGSMLVILGDDTTVGPDLARVLAGKISPASGRILLEDVGIELGSSESRGIVEYVPGSPSFPSGITLREHLSIAAAAAGHRRKRTGEILAQLMSWCSLEEYAGSQVMELPEEKRYMAAFAAACLPVPGILILQGPLPGELHPLLEDLCQGGASVIACLPGIEYMPQSADRIALCDVRDVRRIVRFGELSEACSSLMRLQVKFFPALPRAVMESLPGARHVVAVQGGYEFLHGGLSATVTNLVNLARANSRQIAGLEVRSPRISELVEHFTAEEETGEADLFCGEDLDI